MASFTNVQDYQDALVQRFASPGRRVTARTAWFDDNTDFAGIEMDCRKHILFYEARGYALFGEPQIDHEPLKNRFRGLLTFKPTENNGG